MPEIHIIIVTYNAMKWAERCFTSLRTSSVPVKSIVIDNGSVDGTQDYIKNNFPEVDFTQSQTNLGFGKANNIGIDPHRRNRKIPGYFFRSIYC
jgi:N-acetylglucosaminyl-diphospho-decaprenol L-rhamnosyltransferase